MGVMCPVNFVESLVTKQLIKQLFLRLRVYHGTYFTISIIRCELHDLIITERKFN